MVAVPLLLPRLCQVRMVPLTLLLATDFGGRAVLIPRLGGLAGLARGEQPGLGPTVSTKLRCWFPHSTPRAGSSFCHSRGLPTRSRGAARLAVCMESAGALLHVVELRRRLPQPAPRADAPCRNLTTNDGCRADHQGNLRGRPNLTGSRPSAQTPRDSALVGLQAGCMGRGS